jgi:hypothetical protein
MAKEEPKEKEVGTGPESWLEIAVGNRLAVVIHLFLSVLAVLLLVAASIATYDTVLREYPKLWQQESNEYVALQAIIETLLLIAIAVEFALLLLFRRMSAVVEVLVFVLARKALNPDIHALELVLVAAAIAGLIILRFYYLPGETT